MQREPIPDIDFSSVTGPKRGPVPDGYDYDEARWSPDRRHVVVGYSITEAAMMTYVGRVLWASVFEQRVTVLGNPAEVLISCWHSPWCKWLDEHAFAFKTYLNRGRQPRTPTAVVHLEHGFAVLPFTINSPLGPDPSILSSLSYQPFSDRAFTAAVDAA